MKGLIVSLLIATGSVYADDGGFPSSFSRKGINKAIFNGKIEARKQGKKVILSGKNCEDLNKEAEAIAQWGKKKGKANCQCDSEDCEIDVTALVPDFVRESQGVCPIKPGPNCWNASLISAGLTSTFRYSTGEEMKFWMTSPLCRERSPNEAPEAGDIIAIRSQNGEEVHGFVNLTSNISFSKNGYTNLNCYSLQSPEYVYQVYQVPKGCERIPVGSATNCPFYGNVFKCESIDEYLKQKSLRPETSETMKALNKLECNFAFLLKDQKGMDNFRQITGLTRISLLAIIDLAKKEIASELLSEEDKFIWRGIDIKAKALVIQLEDLRE